MTTWLYNYLKSFIALSPYLINLCELHPWVGRHAICSNLPKKDPKGPDIRLGGELVVSKTLSKLKSAQNQGFDSSALGVMYS